VPSLGLNLPNIADKGHRVCLSVLCWGLSPADPSLRWLTPIFTFQYEFDSWYTFWIELSPFIFFFSYSDVYPVFYLFSTSVDIFDCCSIFYGPKIDDASLLAFYISLIGVFCSSFSFWTSSTSWMTWPNDTILSYFLLGVTPVFLLLDGHTFSIIADLSLLISKADPFTYLLCSFRSPSVNLG
jgi:hypothetical protein